MTLEQMIARFSEKQDKICKEVYQKSKEIKAFEYEGSLFIGDLTRASVLFAYNNPTGGDFHVWLQDHYKQLY